jgi:hypothetical protein
MQVTAHVYDNATLVSIDAPTAYYLFTDAEDALDTLIHQGIADGFTTQQPREGNLDIESFKANCHYPVSDMRRPKVRRIDLDHAFQPQSVLAPIESPLVQITGAVRDLLGEAALKAGESVEDDYLRGMANGLEIALAVLEDREPTLIATPDRPSVEDEDQPASPKTETETVTATIELAGGAGAAGSPPAAGDGLARETGLSGVAPEGSVLPQAPTDVQDGDASVAGAPLQAEVKDASGNVAADVTPDTRSAKSAKGAKAKEAK